MLKKKKKMNARDQDFMVTGKCKYVNSRQRKFCTDTNTFEAADVLKI